MYLEDDEKGEVIFDNELALLEDIRSRCNADNYVKEPTEKFKPKKDYQHYKLSTGQHVYINQSEDMFVLTKEVPGFSGIEYQGVPMISLQHWDNTSIGNGVRTSIEYTSRDGAEKTTACISRKSASLQHKNGEEAHYHISYNFGEGEKYIGKTPDGVKTMLDFITAQPANTLPKTGSFLPLSDSDQKRIDKDIGAFSKLLLPACAEKLVSEKNELQDKLDDATKKIQDAEKKIQDAEERIAKLEKDNEKRIAELENENKTLKDGVAVLMKEISDFIKGLAKTKDKLLGTPVKDIKNLCRETFGIEVKDNEIKRLNAPENPGK